MQTLVAPRKLPRPAPRRGARPVRLSERTRELLAGAAAMAIPLVVALFALGVWGGISTVPWYYGGAATSPQFGFDENLNLMLVKGLLDHGWWFHNPDLGA